MKKGLWLKMIFLGWGQCAPSFIQCFGTVCWVTERTAIHEKKLYYLCSKVLSKQVEEENCGSTD